MSERATTATVDSAAPRGWLGAPNPIWMREMRQALRLTQTPWVLLALTLTIALSLCAIGGVAASEHTSPARVGRGLFQAFFSISYLVVVVVGPSIAANGIAAEREGRTWEAVLLAGLDATQLTRGKFLAAYTTLALYIVTLAPVGALSFLFGGVTATEVVVAFGCLFAIAALAVAFGLAVSSLMANLRGALVATLALAVAVGPLLYLFFGLAGGQAAHTLWPAVERETPIWLPLALTRAELGAPYLMVLLLVPAALLLVPGRFLYTVTVANLTAETDDGSTGLKRWLVFSAPALLAVAVVPVVLTSAHPGDAAIASECVAFLVTLFVALLFAREPVGPSRRVRVRWERERASRLTRWLGPGLMRTSALVVLTSLASLGTLGIISSAVCEASPRTTVDQTHVLITTSYGCAFLVFVVGLTTLLRARGLGVWATRVVVAAVIFLASAAPWVVAAILGALSGGDKEWIAVAAPSPFYVFYMIDQVSPFHDTAWSRVAVGFGAQALWVLLGVLALWRANVRCAALLAAEERAVARAEATLADDDALHAQA